jgi:hypothetical protein
MIESKHHGKKTGDSELHGGYIFEPRGMSEGKDEQLDGRSIDGEDAHDEGSALVGAGISYTLTSASIST